MTAEFWQYDSRIGRRWNVDIVNKIWLSPYSAFRGNPLLYIDPREDDDIFSATGKFLGRSKEGHSIRVIDNNATFKQAVRDLNANTRLITQFHYCPDNLDKRVMLLQIINHYAPASGLDQPIQLGDVDGKKFGDAFAFWDSKSKTFNFAISSTTGAINKEAANYNNLIVTFVHEKVHKDDPKTSQPLFHVNAIIASAKSNAFEGTTESFKQLAGTYASRLLNEALNKGVGLTDINSKINEFNSSKFGAYAELKYNESTKSVESSAKLQDVIIKVKAKRKG